MRRALVTAARVVLVVVLFLAACVFSMYVVALDLAWYGGNP